MNGSDIFVMLDMGSESAPDYQVIGCQRDSTFEETSDTIDESCKDSRAMRVDYGRYSSTISLDLLFRVARADLALLNAANRAGDYIYLLRLEIDEIRQRARAKIDSLSYSFPDQGEAEISLAVTVDNFIENVWIIGTGAIGTVFIG